MFKCKNKYIEESLNRMIENKSQIQIKDNIETTRQLINSNSKLLNTMSRNYY